MGTDSLSHYAWYNRRDSRLGKFDSWLGRSVEDGMMFAVSFLLPAVTVFAMLFAIYGMVDASRQPPPPSVTVTVTETSTMLETGAFAEAVDPSGQAVLLRGEWITGDEVPSYPKPRPEAPDAAPIYSTTSPLDPMEVVGSWFVMGAVIGLIVVPLSTYLYVVLRKRHYRKLDRSRRLVDAALS